MNLVQAVGSDGDILALYVTSHGVAESEGLIKRIYQEAWDIAEEGDFEESYVDLATNMLESKGFNRVFIENITVL